MKTKVKKPTISFFCPAYYDEKNLPLLIPKAVEVLKKNAEKFEIIIIEDKSPDDTARVSDELAIKFKPYVKVVHHRKNHGYGGALISGFDHANKYSYVFYTDGDMQYDVGELELFLPYLARYDVIIGYRSKRALGLTRTIQTKLFNMIVTALFGLRVKDINCSMKIIKRSALKNIKLTSNGGFIDAELLIKLKKLNYNIKEIEVSHFPRYFGKASGGKPKIILQTILEMIKFYFKKTKYRNIL